MKKILILGGKPIGTYEIVKYCQSIGYYVIVTDFLPKDKSIGKKIADEYWDISTADTNALVQKCVQYKVNGVFTGIHEFNIEMMIKLCNKLSLPCYLSLEQWSICKNKAKFKQLCNKFNIPNSRQYKVDFSSEEGFSEISYPVIVKPADSSGSRGFHICKSLDELQVNYKKALAFSPTHHVLIEEYQPYDSVIIHYTIHKGNVLFCGLSDKKSVLLESTGASVMGIQTFPSSDLDKYLSNLNHCVTKMLESLNFKECALWIEAFNNNGSFIINEIGLRYGGSLTYYPIQHFYEIDQLEMLIKHHMSEENEINYKISDCNHKYCIIPFHLKPGVIKKEIGLNEIQNKLYIKAFVRVHYLGDLIEDWGSAQQVYCYLHFVYDNEWDLIRKIENTFSTLQVLDTENENMLYCTLIES